MRAAKIDLPRFIALVGQPKTGKSAVQSHLAKYYGAQTIDSGFPLREIAMKYYGLTQFQVYTQEGKQEYVQILGRRWQVRELLGELGNRFEEMHGDWATPWMMTRDISPKNLGPFCDASCRKSQGAYYKSIGGVCIGIKRPGTPDSKYAFDQVREEHVDEWIINDGTLLDLEKKVDMMMSLLARYRAH